MKKREFLSALSARLSGLPTEDIERYTEFYTESIDDRIEEGMSEEEAVADLGSLDEITEQILRETPLPTLLKEKLKPKQSLRGWQIALIVIGSPLWIAAGVICLSLLLVLFVLLWALVIVVYAVFAGFVASAMAAGAAGVLSAVYGNATVALFCFGAALILAGLSILLFLASVGATKGVVRLCGKLLLSIKSIFVRKENVQ